MADPAPYPRIYRAAWGSRVWEVILGLILAVVGPAILWHGGVPDTGKPHSLPIAIGITAFIVLAGLAILWMSFGTYVVLHADAIEAIEPIRRRRLARTDIDHRTRVSGSKGGSFMALVPGDRSEPMLLLPKRPRTDAAWATWMAPIPERPYDAAQEARERKAALRTAVATDPGWGPDPARRLRRLNAYGKLTIGFLGLTIVASAACFLPWDSDAAIGAGILLPLVAFPILWGLRGPMPSAIRGQPTNPLDCAVFAVAGVVLAYRTIYDLHFYDWTPLLAIALIGGTILTLALLAADAGLRAAPKWAPLYFALLSIYAFGAAAEANRAIDRTEPNTYPAAVVAFHETHGKGASYRIGLAPWGPSRTTSEFNVSRSFYDTLHRGQILCVVSREGVLGLAWYAPGPCPPPK